MRESSPTSKKDLIALVVAAAVAFVVAVYFDVFENLERWAQDYERWELDELVVVPLVLALASGYYSWRRRRELKESEERFRSLVQNASDVILIMGADQTVRYISPAVERVLGYKTEDVIGKNNLAPVHPDDTARVQRAVAGAVSNPGAPSYVELRLGHADGSWRHMAAHRVDLHQLAGRPGGGWHRVQLPGRHRAQGGRGGAQGKRAQVPHARRADPGHNLRGGHRRGGAQARGPLREPPGGGAARLLDGGMDLRPRPPGPHPPPRRPRAGTGRGRAHRADRRAVPRRVPSAGQGRLGGVAARRGGLGARGRGRAALLAGRDVRRHPAEDDGGRVQEERGQEQVHPRGHPRPHLPLRPRRGVPGLPGER